ncbi:MAG: hypothetical protein FD147_2154 [Chloroflexi bacterium]|nr:MAG: hypothetical protein FD147_2154 [Chloroflexota bacterium]MBA4376529.1 hypothetical protein [Anaerolinea sp.]
MNRNPGRPKHSKPPVKSSLPSYRSGWGFIIASVIWEVLGRIFSGALANSARGQAVGDYVFRMNQVAILQGFVDLIMVVLFFIGIIFLVRTYLARSKAAKKT